MGRRSSKRVLGSVVGDESTVDCEYLTGGRDVELQDNAKVNGPQGVEMIIFAFPGREGKLATVGDGTGTGPWVPYIVPA